MAETGRAMAEATSANFIVSLIVGSMAKKPARATCATEGGGDAGAEAKVQAAAEGSEARVFFASGGIGVLPAEVGITLGSCSLSKGAAEDDGIEVEHASGGTGKGGKEVPQLLVEVEVLGVLSLLGVTESVSKVAVHKSFIKISAQYPG